MKGPYVIINSKGQICDYGYSEFNTNEEGRQHILESVNSFKKLLDETINKNASI